MPELKRYTSFEKLKSDAKPNNTSTINKNGKISQLEEFIKILRKELLAKKDEKKENQ